MMQPTAQPFQKSAPVVNDLSNFSLPSTRAQNKGGISGFLTRNLPTIGSIAAPTIGALLAPETGGLSLAAGLALSGAGGAGGQVAKNALQNQSLTKDVGSAGVQGAVGELTGRGIGKGLGILSKVVTKPIEAGAAKAAEGKALQTAISDTQPFQGVPKATLQNNDLNGTLSHLKNLGVQSTPESMHGAANLVTGDNGVVSGTVRQLLGNVGSVSTSGVMDTAKQAINNEVVHLGELGAKGSAANGLLASVRNTLNGIADNGMGNISGKSDANGIFDTIQQIEGRVRELGGVKATGTNGAEARVLDKTSKALMDKLSSGGADNAVATHNLHPTDVTAIQDAAQKLGAPQLGEHIVQGVNSAKSLGDLRKLQRPFVQASNLAGAADKAAGGALPKVAGGNGFNGLSSVYEAGALAHGNLAAAIPLGAKLASKEPVSGILTKLSKGENAAKTINEKALPGSATAGGVLSRLAGQAATGTGKIPDSNAQQQPAVTPSSTDLLPPPDQTNATDASQQQAPVFGQDKLVAAIAADPKNASTYMSLYTLMNKPPANTVKPTSQQVGSAQGTELSLQNLESIINKNPGIVNKTAIPGGGLPIVGGLINRAAGTGDYNAAATNVANELGRLQSGANLTKQEEQMYRNLLPKAGDSQETIAFKLQQIQQSLQPYLTTQVGQ